VILDIMLPVLDGFSVCRRLRDDSRTRDILVLILSARSSEADQLQGFRAGADDYVTKPFSTRVLLERAKALLRRPESDGEADLVSNQGLAVDRVRHRVIAGEELLDLTLTEFSLLDVLIRHPGRAFSRAELIDGALGQAIVMERTIDVHVLSLRRKLGRYAQLIETVRGVGYRFRDPEQLRPDAFEVADRSR
jgi:two-component system phosphate regulon response regulator PhoB